MTLISPHRDWAISDQALAAFLKNLRPQSLESLERTSYHDLGLDVFHALSHHGESLTKLKFFLLGSSTIPKISLIKDCPNLFSLSLTGNGLYTTGLKNSCNDEFLEMLAWLTKCKQLRLFCLTDFFSVSALMAPVLLESGIHFKTFDSVMRNTYKFHQALANNTSLPSVWLRRFVDEYALEADILVESLSKLVNLTELRLAAISDSLVDRHILQLASSLPKLESG